MKKLSFIAIALITVISIYALSGSNLSIGLSSMNLKKTGTRAYIFSFSVSHSGFLPGLFEGISISIPHEYYLARGYIENNRINESDFIYAGINFDINGDGDYADAYSLAYIRGVYYLGKTPLKIITAPHRFNDMKLLTYYGKDGIKRLTRTAADAPGFIVYSVNKKDKTITIGLGSKDKPIQFIEIPNPCVRIEILAPSQGLSSPPAFSLSGLKTYVSYTNEKLIEGYADQWLAKKWAVVPLEIKEDTTISKNISIENITRPFAVRASVLLSLEKGVILESVPKVSVVK